MGRLGFGTFISTRRASDLTATATAHIYQESLSASNRLTIVVFWLGHIADRLCRISLRRRLIIFADATPTRRATSRWCFGRG